MTIRDERVDHVVQQWKRKYATRTEQNLIRSLLPYVLQLPESYVLSQRI